MGKKSMVAEVEVEPKAQGLEEEINPFQMALQNFDQAAALLDLEDPRRLISRLPHWILAPHEWYEVTGDVPNVVFACGAVERGDEIHLYYGAADTYICLAYAKTADLLDALLAHKVNSRIPAGVSY